MKPDNIVRIPCDNTSIFKYWLMFLEPFHNLTKRELEVMACILKKRFELSKSISDNALLDKVLLGDEIKKEIRTECNITVPHYQVILGKLKNSGIIVDGNVNPKFIPNIKEDSENFKLLLFFEIKKDGGRSIDKSSQ